MKINLHTEPAILLVTKEKNYNKVEDKKFFKTTVAGKNRVSYIVYTPLHKENRLKQGTTSIIFFPTWKKKKHSSSPLIFHEMAVKDKVQSYFRIL